MAIHNIHNLNVGELVGKYVIVESEHYMHLMNNTELRIIKASQKMITVERLNSTSRRYNFSSVLAVADTLDEYIALRKEYNDKFNALYTANREAETAIQKEFQSAIVQLSRN